MIMVWLMLAVMAGALVYIGSNIYDKGYKQLGAVFILVGVFQLIAQIVVML